MANKQSGKNATLKKGANTVAEMVEWSMSGATNPVMTKDAAFGDSVVEKKSMGLINPGTISCRGNYDPNDSNGHQALETAFTAGTEMTDLYLYTNTSTFWRVGSGGFIVCTKAKAVGIGRNGFANASYEFEVSDAEMEQVGTGS